MGIMNYKYNFTKAYFVFFCILFCRAHLARNVWQPSGQQEEWQQETGGEGVCC